MPPSSEAMTDSGKILIVDDDPRVRKLLVNYFEEQGFGTMQAEDGPTLRACLKQGDIDLIMLDIGLPGEDGLTLAREVRGKSAVPIIIITGKGDVVDRVVGLELGADDYITKPFHLREVLARVRSVLRRSPPATLDQAAVTPMQVADETTETITFAGWRLDLTARDLRAPDGEPVVLTTAEFDLLLAFAGNANRPLSRDTLMDRTRGRDWTPFDRSIDTQVARLRKKIETDPNNPQLIKTVRGLGYLFTPKVESL